MSLEMLGRLGDWDGARGDTRGCKLMSILVITKEFSSLGICRGEKPKTAEFQRARDGERERWMNYT